MSKMLGIGKEFSLGDRIIYMITVIWSAFWFITFVIGTIYCVLVKPFSDETWIKWWLFSCVVFGVTGVIATIWFLWGGFRDLKYLFSDLRTATRDESDDGTVMENHNLDDESVDNDKT